MKKLLFSAKGDKNHINITSAPAKTSRNSLRQNSMGAVKEVESMLLHPYSREQKLAQINSLHQKAVSKISQNSELEGLVF